MRLPLLLLAVLVMHPSALATRQPAQTPASRDDDRDPTPLVVRAARIDGALRPVLDGQPDEPAWALAEVATGFTQLRPEPGAVATQHTEALVLYDDAAVYVAFRNYDTEPDRIIARLARRDDWVLSDHVLVAFDSYGDGRTAFMFAVNAAGVKYDFLAYNDTQEDASWDAVWDAAVARTAYGWAAEFRIPLSQLRYPHGQGAQEWGVEFKRSVARLGEDSFWAPLLPEVDGVVSRFGRLRGIEGLAAPRRLEVQPYVASSLTREPGEAADPFYRANDFGASAGVDLRYGLTSNLTLAATLNPDFGQVEADPAVVNLSAFETFFEERRPFFVEGVDIFNFGRTRSYVAEWRPTFFYSRRIGRSPHRHLDDDGIDYVDRPNETTIAAATKLSGKVGGWSLGVLDAVTVEESAEYLTAGGERAYAPVEPFSNYFVGRVKRDFRGGASVVGGLVTTTLRSMSDPAFDELVPSASLVAGLDFEHAWANRRWNVSGVLAGSAVRGDAAYIEVLQEAPQRYLQRPDAGHLGVDPARTGLDGAYGEIALAKTSGKWRGSLSGTFITPGFDVNDLGFQFRSDIYGLTGIVLYNENGPTQDWLRSWGANVFAGTGYNGDGDWVSHFMGTNMFLTHRDQWSAGLHLGGSLRTKNDRLTRGGPLGEVPGNIRFNPWVETDTRKPVSVNAWAYFRTEFVDNPEGDREGGFDVTVRPSSSVQLTLGPSLSWQYDTDQYITDVADPVARATFGTRYVFADIEQTSLSMSTRLNWTFSPDLSLQLFARPFVTSGRYAGYKEFRTPGTYDFTVYGTDRGSVEWQSEDVFVVDPGDGGASFTFDRPDFNVRSLRGSAVLRWEYRPGSTVFVVWQQQRDGSAAYGDFDFGRDVGALFRGDVQNIFLVKLSYWLGV